MSDVWIPSDEEYNEMCRRCENSGSNALKLFKRWIDHTRRSRPICKETFCPADSKNKQAPLVLAANSGNAHIVRYLLTECSSVIDINCKGDIGRHSGSIYRTPFISHKLHNVEGITALWAACCWGNREIAQLLLRAGADVNAATTSSTPMEIAAFNGHCEIMELLYSYGVDVNMRNDQDCSPLMAAASTNQINAVIFLLEHGADVGQKNAKGYTVFHVAAASGSLDVIHILKRKGFAPNFELPQSTTTSCPYFIAVSFGHNEIAEELNQAHVYTKEYESETHLLIGARYVMKRLQQLPVQSILDSWRKAVRLRNACGYMPNFLPTSDMYAGLSEITTEKDLVGPCRGSKFDMETWVRHQSLLIMERIVGPPFTLRGLLHSGSILCEKKMFKQAELLWLQSIEYYSTYNTDIFVGSEIPNFKTCIYEYALGIHRMVLLQYRPDFSKFVEFSLKILSKMFIDIVTVELILWIFASWIRSDCVDGECDYYSDECEELGRELVSQLFHINKKKTLLQLAVSNFKIHHQNAHVLFGPYYQHLVLALLRWGCSQDIYSITGHSHLIHEAVKVGNEYHVDIVTPLLKYGSSPLFVDSKGRTALQLATSDVMLRMLRSHSLSLFSMCCVAMVKYGFPYESLQLPSVVKNNIRLFDKNSRCGK